jgi:hypothetical protein
MEEILALANFGRQLTREQIQMVMLPGRFSQPTEFGGRSFWIVSERGRDRVMDQYFGVEHGAQEQPSRSFERLRIAIQNSTGNPELVERVKNYLRQQNFRNVYTIQDATESLENTEIIAQQGDLRSARSLQKLFGFGQVEASSTGDLGSDLTIRIGSDAEQWTENNSFSRSDSANP